MQSQQSFGAHFCAVSKVPQKDPRRAAPGRFLTARRGFRFGRTALGRRRKGAMGAVSPRATRKFFGFRVFCRAHAEPTEFCC